MPPTGRHVAAPISVRAEPRESAPSDPQRRRTDADNPWRPDPDNMSPEAALKRDNLADARIGALEADRDADRAAMGALTVEVRGVKASLDGWGKRWDDFWTTARAVGLWTLKGVVGVLIVVGVGAAIAYAARVRVEPPGLPPAAGPR